MKFRLNRTRQKRSNCTLCLILKIIIFIFFIYFFIYIICTSFHTIFNQTKLLYTMPYIDYKNDSNFLAKIIIPSWLFHDYMFPVQLPDAIKFDQIQRIIEQQRFERSLKYVYSLDSRPDQVIVFVPTTVDNYHTGIPIRGGFQES